MGHLGRNISEDLVVYSFKENPALQWGKDTDPETEESPLLLPCPPPSPGVKLLKQGCAFSVMHHVRQPGDFMIKDPGEGEGYF